jgi:hypothetical protein
VSGPFTARAGRKGVLFVLVVVAAIASADEVLFPEPLHFVRRLTGIDGGVETLHEYCSGNQVVTVSEGRVVVADFTKQELLEIDRESATYAITSFAALAAAAPLPKTSQASWKASPSVARSGGGSFVAESEGVTVELRAHERLTVSRRALDVLLGAAWPNQPPPGHDVVVEGLRATRDPRRLEPVSNAAAEERFALPAARTVTARVGPDVVRWKSEIVSVDNARVPPDALLIPVGARLVESVAERVKRELDQLDRLPYEKQ